MEKPFATTKPNLPEATSIIGDNGLLGMPTLKAGTSQWFTPMISNGGESTVGVHPYVVKLAYSGLDVTYPVINNTPTVVTTTPLSKDIRFAVDGARGHKVIAYDPMTVTVAWGTVLTACIVRGSPYVTWRVNGASWTINSERNVDALTQASPTKWILKLGGPQSWVIYTSSAVSLVKDGTTIRCSTPFTGSVRVARLITPDADTILDRYAGPDTIITGSSVVVNKVSATLATVKLTWISKSPPLQLTLPHHVKVLASGPVTPSVPVGPSGNLPSAPVVPPVTPAAPVVLPSAPVAAPTVQIETTNQACTCECAHCVLVGPHNKKLVTAVPVVPVTPSVVPEVPVTPSVPSGDNGALVYGSIRGPMRSIVGSTWTLNYPLSGITWTAPRAPDQDKVATIQNSLAGDINAPIDRNEVYEQGKQLARLAQLLLIAQVVNQPTQVGLDKLKNAIKPWLTGGRGQDNYMYENRWGGILPAQSVNNPSANYNSGTYADQMIHNGHIVYALAVIAKLDPAWITASYRDLAIALVRNYANPSKNDPFFPVVRHMDWYEGFSYLQGFGSFEEGMNVESSSEVVMGYYAAQLLGLALNIPDMATFGEILTAVQIQGTQTYWHLKSDSEVIGDPFRKNKVVGILFSESLKRELWWTNDPVKTMFIQLLPVMPITEALIDKPWAVEASPLYRDHPEDWVRQYLIVLQAVVDKQGAWQRSLQLPSYDNGSARSIQNYWVATRPQ
jgi:endoglucanase Acf2